MKENSILFNDELPYQMALTQVDGIGPLLAKNLISHCGSASAIFKENTNYLRKIPGIGYLTSLNIRKFNQFNSIDKEIELMFKQNIKPFFYFDPNYPFRLKQIDDGPILIYVKGDLDLNPQKAIAIVGTRKASVYGRQFTDDFILALKPFCPTVISGLAAGTDTNVHKYCLKYGVPTIGVLGHGFGTVYPSSNRSLAHEMEQNGALISEYFFNAPGVKENFPQRNRIVAAMSDDIIVVESGIKGGSLITADLANQYNREVYALPGKINDTWSLGCNHLVANHQAYIIPNISFLLKNLGLDESLDIKKSNKYELFNQLTEDELVIHKILLNGVKGIDDLHFESGLNVSKLSLLLLDMEFKNLIKVLPGKVFSL